ncbi:MAG: hypothetical protein K0R00_3127 [Herbinix sp.]|jgi:hypothetical protein|nr:hypothetical protein [Herbinix sp.]
MESILKKLYYAYLNQDEFLYDKNTEYSSINKKAIEVMESLEKKVSEEDYKTIIMLMDLHNESVAIETEDAFKCGFKHGVLIMIEILKDKNNL